MTLIFLTRITPYGIRSAVIVERSTPITPIRTTRIWSRRECLLCGGQFWIVNGERLLFCKTGVIAEFSQPIKEGSRLTTITRIKTGAGIDFQSKTLKILKKAS